jgi:DNA-binding CsgD family transcriptional regulator
MRDGWYANNPRVTRGVSALKHPQDIITEYDIFTPEELKHLPFNAEFITGTGMGGFAGLLLAPAGPSSIIISLERSLQQEPFSRAEIEVIRRVVPHVQRAGHLALKMSESHMEGVLDGLEMMACGGVLLDGLGRALRINNKAEATIRKGGLSLFNKQLSARDRQADIALQRLIGSALRSGSPHDGTLQHPIVIPRPFQCPLIVHVAPVVGSARDLFQRGKAVLMLVDPDEHRQPAEPILQQAFGLTPAEARIAIALAAGGDLTEIARSSQIAIGTARTQLKAIFAKTGTHRQGELVALLGRFAMPLSGP